MKPFRGFGVGGHNYHPRARDDVNARRSRRIKHEKDVRDLVQTDMTEQYFVPSFSILRHLQRDEESYWVESSRQIGRVLGRGYKMTPAEDVTIKSLEQKALIRKIRESGERPDAEAMRDMVFNLRDDLTTILERAPDPLAIGLGKLAVFGQRQNRLGFTISGWQGWRARYEYDDLGALTSLDALLAENRVALGNISAAFPDMSFSESELVATPHITIARKMGATAIQDFEIRRFQAQIDDLDIDTALLFGDPIISYKLGPDQPSQVIPIRHSWRSLAPMPGDFNGSEEVA